MKTQTYSIRVFVLAMMMLIPAMFLIARPVTNNSNAIGTFVHFVLPLPVGDKMNINWSGWNNYPNTNIFYRIQIVPAGSTNPTVAVEVLNNYHKEISVAVALNDDGLKAVYQQIKNLKKNTSTVINYPRPKDVNQFFASFNNLEMN